MGHSMFIELWSGLRDLLGDNNTENDINDSKRFINWTVRDLAQQYDWEFLRGEKEITAVSGSGLYDLSNISQITATNQSIYVQSDSASDNGLNVSIFGKEIGPDSKLTISTDAIPIVNGATASGAIQYSHIDSIRKAVSTGNITITNTPSGGDVIATMSPNETYIANDINKINIVINNTNSRRILPYDNNTYELGNPNNSNLGNLEAYDLDYEGKLRLYNVPINSTVSIYYQRTPRWLVNNQDRLEFPDTFSSKIINASYEGYGLRYRDQADANFGKQRYLELLKDIVNDWVTGKDQPIARVKPLWYKRRL